MGCRENIKLIWILQSTAGIDIGLIFDDFTKYASHKVVSEQEYNSLSNNNNLWCVVHFKGVDILGRHYDSYSCRGNNDVTLQFDGISEKVLYGIIVSGDYTGALFNELRISDRLNKLSDKYDLDFYADSHYLVYQDNHDECVTVEIGIDYLVDYLYESTQVIEIFYVMMHLEQQEKHGISWD